MDFALSGRGMRGWKIVIGLLLICSAASGLESRLPFERVFKGQDQFNRLVAKAKEQNWKSLPIGERTAAVGQALLGTRYKHFTLEIDNRIEAQVSSRPLYQIGKNRVGKIELKLQSGDIIGIISRDRSGLYSTSHVGLALRTSDGVLHFMHASSPSNYGKVVIDSRLSSYLQQYRTDSGILVARPVK